MQEITLSNHSLKAFVDDEDYNKVVLVGTWRYARGYAVSTMCNERVYMHNIVKAPPFGFRNDHKDRNKLNNQKENLRFATKSQNSVNSKLRSTNTTGYRGLERIAKLHKWRVRIRVNYKFIHVGYFLTRENAALAYNEAAKKYFGEFAQLNILPTI